LHPLADRFHAGLDLRLPLRITELDDGLRVAEQLGVE